MKEIKVKITFRKPILGSLPADESVFLDFIATRAPIPATIDEEVDAINPEYRGDDDQSRGYTLFPRTADGTPFLYDYQIKGFFKSACSALRRVTLGEIDNKASHKLKAHKKIIDTLIFINEREIPLEFDGEVTKKARSLRAQTAQGDRISIAVSEMIPAGATAEFTVRCLDSAHIDAVKEWLSYGIYNGIGCWRNSGLGQFEWEEV